MRRPDPATRFDAEAVPAGRVIEIYGRAIVFLARSGLACFTSFWVGVFGRIRPEF